MAVVSQEIDIIIHKKHASGKVVSLKRSCAIAVNLMKHVLTILVDFRKYFLGIVTYKAWLSETETPSNSDSYDSFRLRSIDAVTKMQLRSIRHDSYDQFAEIFYSRILKYPIHQ